MSVDKKIALKDILSYIKDTYPTFSEWYVGVSINPFDNLHKYNVDEIKDAWIIRNLNSVSDANYIFSVLINSYNLNKSEAQDINGNSVFVYRKKLN